MQQIEIRDEQAERLATLAAALDEHAGPYASAGTVDAVEFLLDLAGEVGDRAEGTEPETDAVSTAVDMAGVELTVGTDEPTADDGEAEGDDEQSPGDGESNGTDNGGGDEESEPAGSGGEADGDEGTAANDDAGDESGGDESDTDGDGTANGAASNDATADDGGDVFDLLREHDDKWRKSGGDEPYEVDLPDGGTEHVRTRGDVKAILFKNYR